MYKIRKILVPVDFSTCSHAALDHALSLGAQHGAEVALLHVADLASFDSELRVSTDLGGMTLHDYAVRAATKDLDGFLSDFDAEQRAHLKTSIEGGNPRETILRLARRGGYDLLVMGTHGRTGRAHSLAGSVTESVVRAAPCPVLTVREGV